MANISHFTQTVNGVSTTYDIHDANAVDLTNNQTVGGIKTFSNAPVVNSISLDGKTIDTDANGNMTYDNHIIDTIEEQGNGYIRYSNGLQICWGIGTVSFNNSTQGESTFTYPEAFISSPAISITAQGGSPTFIFETIVNSYTTSCDIIARLNSIQTAERGFYYTVIGKWK